MDGGEIMTTKMKPYSEAAWRAARARIKHMIDEDILCDILIAKNKLKRPCHKGPWTVGFLLDYG